MTVCTYTVWCESLQESFVRDWVVLGSKFRTRVENNQLILYHLTGHWKLLHPVCLLMFTWTLKTKVQLVVRGYPIAQSKVVKFEGKKHYWRLSLCFSEFSKSFEFRKHEITITARALYFACLIWILPHEIFLDFFCLQLGAQIDQKEYYHEVSANEI